MTGKTSPSGRKLFASSSLAFTGALCVALVVLGVWAFRPPLPTIQIDQTAVYAKDQAIRAAPEQNVEVESISALDDSLDPSSFLKAKPQTPTNDDSSTVPTPTISESIDTDVKDALESLAKMEAEERREEVTTSKEDRQEESGPDLEESKSVADASQGGEAAGEALNEVPEPAGQSGDRQGEDKVGEGGDGEAAGEALNEVPEPAGQSGDSQGEDKADEGGDGEAAGEAISEVSEPAGKSGDSQGEDKVDEGGDGEAAGEAINEVPEPAGQSGDGQGEDEVDEGGDGEAAGGAINEVPEPAGQSVDGQGEEKVVEGGDEEAAGEALNDVPEPASQSGDGQGEDKVGEGGDGEAAGGAINEVPEPAGQSVDDQGEDKVVEGGDGEAAGEAVDEVPEPAGQSGNSQGEDKVVEGGNGEAAGEASVEAPEPAGKSSNSQGEDKVDEGGDGEAGGDALSEVPGPAGQSDNSQGEDKDEGHQEEQGGQLESPSTMEESGHAGEVEAASATKEAVGANAELENEAKESPSTDLDTQRTESIVENTFEKGPDGAGTGQNVEKSQAGAGQGESLVQVVDDENESHDYLLCPESKTDYIPCLDNTKAIKALSSRHHFQHRERHCPPPQEFERCFVPLPEDYKFRVDWPASRDTIWYSNVPHTKLVTYKKDQNWVRQKGDKLVFPGGGTQFKYGAMHYINFIEEVLPEIQWGERVCQALDIGCGVASWGAYLFKKGVTTMSVAPKDEHEAQVQFALERGVPALLGVMGTQRLTFPSNSYDLVHCARCRVGWHLDGGMLLVELNRVLRPGGYFVWSATPVYKSDQADTDVWNGEVQTDAEVWKAMSDLTSKMCWTLVALEKTKAVGVAIWKKSVNNTCLYDRPQGTEPPLCDPDDNPDAAWYVPMNTCLHRIPVEEGSRGTEWPPPRKARLADPPAWLASIGTGIYGQPAREDCRRDKKHWAKVVYRSYSMAAMGIVWTHVRNVMDMRAGYGGFAVALSKRPMWVMNVVPTSSPDTLSIIFDRGLIGVYHDWCESFNTYPRTYDLLHCDHVLSIDAQRCKISDIMLEMDRILRPGGYAIIRDTTDILLKAKAIAADFHWNTLLEYTEGKEGFLAINKTMWRPKA
eukprot:SM000260S09948  [mRNA]  locus=s260:114816:120959:- [translate_table: standard]